MSTDFTGTNLELFKSASSLLVTYCMYCTFKYSVCLVLLFLFFIVRSPSCHYCNRICMAGTVNIHGNIKLQDQRIKIHNVKCMCALHKAD